MLTVLIEDVNDNNPVFPKCSTYRPRVPEQSPIGTHVVTVKAIDTDRGRNGQVRKIIFTEGKGVNKL